MHYATKAKAEIDSLKREQGIMLERVIQLRVYLNSSKFHEDTTIQVTDVHRWLDHITEGSI